MALIKKRRRENVEGDFFVDQSCIDCDLCREIDPGTYGASGRQSYVHHQPQGEVAKLQALKALVCCPTSSIGTVSRTGVKTAVDCYPESICDGVFFCGFTSPDSWGARSYFVTGTAGNLMVDVPRFNQPLADGIRALGGLRTILLTHRDDVADHDQWARCFKAERVMHEADIDSTLSAVERVLHNDEPLELNPKWLAIPTPGHTRGHMVFLYDHRVLFSGDHLWWSHRKKQLVASSGVCWYSWEKQIESMRKLQKSSFEWLLPGHGRRVYLDRKRMHDELERCIGIMETQA